MLQKFLCQKFLQHASKNFLSVTLVRHGRLWLQNNIFFLTNPYPPAPKHPLRDHSNMAQWPNDTTLPGPLSAWTSPYAYEGTALAEAALDLHQWTPPTDEEVAMALVELQEGPCELQATQPWVPEVVAAPRSPWNLDSPVYFADLPPTEPAPQVRSAVWVALAPKKTIENLKMVFLGCPGAGREARGLPPAGEARDVHVVLPGDR